MKKALYARRQGGLSHRPARYPRGMVGGCRPQTVRRQPIRRWTAIWRARKNSFGVPASQICSWSRAGSASLPRPPSAPTRVPHPAYRGRRLGAQPAGRSGRAEDSADARADAARLRAPPHTALPPIARPSPCHQLGSRPTPPDAARACSRRRVGGRQSCHQRLRSRECRAAEMRVAGRCGRRRRGRGVCESSMRRARADR